MKREVLDIVRSKVQMEIKKEGAGAEQYKLNGEYWWVGFKQGTQT